MHETRRFREQDVISAGGLRRFRPGVAAVQAALWAATNRQAQLWMVMAVQQRVVTCAELAAAVAAVRRSPRRALLTTLLTDLTGGVESLNELDVAADFRRRGFPEPARQTVRRRPNGSYYLDASLPEYRVVFEVDGIGHEALEQQARDVVRDIDVSAEGDTVVRLPVTAYRIHREHILDAIERLLRSRGWTPAASGRASVESAPAA